MALKLRDNVFQASSATITQTTGVIRTRAITGPDFYWYWQGNTFYTNMTQALPANVKMYAWYDNGSSNTTCRLIQTTPSIHNYDTYPTPPIVNMTPVAMYGPLKITMPQWWNRS